ncbi:MAG: helix-turn-helix domain-containing protein [bacterium]
MTLQTSGFYEAEKLNLHTQTITKNAGLKECVQASLKQYFNILGADDADNMYRLVMDQVEPALLEEVLERCNGNQSRAAKVLGLNRNTLRKKLQQFDLI